MLGRTEGSSRGASVVRDDLGAGVALERDGALPVGALLHADQLQRAGLELLRVRLRLDAGRERSDDESSVGLLGERDGAGSSRERAAALVAEAVRLLVRAGVVDRAGLLALSRLGLVGGRHDGLGVVLDVHVVSNSPKEGRLGSSQARYRYDLIVSTSSAKDYSREVVCGRGKAA